MKAVVAFGVNYLQVLLHPKHHPRYFRMAPFYRLYGGGCSFLVIVGCGFGDCGGGVGLMAVGVVIIVEVVIFVVVTMVVVVVATVASVIVVVLLVVFMGVVILE